MVKWALVDQNNIVQNCIVYDGISELILPENIIAIQVNDWLNKGDDINAPQPEYSGDDDG